MGVKDVNWCWWQVVDSLLGIGMGTALFWLPLYSRSSNLEVAREKLDISDIVVSCSCQWQSIGFLTMFTIYLMKIEFGHLVIFTIISFITLLLHIIMNLKNEFYMFIIFPIPCICVVFVWQGYIDMLIFYDFKGQLIFLSVVRLHPMTVIL